MTTVVSPTVIARPDRAAADYHAFFTSGETGTWTGRVQQVLAEWLERKKDWPIDTVANGDLHHDHRTLRIRSHIADDGIGYRAELNERDTPTGTWTTRLLSVDTGRGGWISLNVTNDQGAFASVPTLAPWLISQLSLRDGDLEYQDRPRQVSWATVDDLIDQILSSERRSPVLVAAAGDEIDFTPWADKLHRWSKEIYGIGHAVALTPEAVDRFNDAIPSGGGVRRWTIRTYLRGVGEDDATRLRRHKILGTERLGTMKDTPVAKLLGRTAREEASRRAPIPEVLKWERRFTRLANRELVMIEHAKPEIVDAEQASSLHLGRAQDDMQLTRSADGTTVESQGTAPMRGGVEESAVAALCEYLRVDVLDQAAVEGLARATAAAAVLRRDYEKSVQMLKAAGKQLELQELHAQVLEDEHRDLERDIEDLYLEVRLAEDARQGAEDEVRRLRAALAREGRAEEAFAGVGEDEKTQSLDSYSQLLDAIAGLVRQP